MGKAAIIYYSMDGNPRQIAEAIRAATGFPIARLDTVVPYTGTDQEIIAQGQEEVNRGFRPELKPLDLRPEDYETLIVGTPTWWYTMASPVLSFLTQVRWEGKTLVPFQTHAGWPGHARQFGKMETPRAELERWIDQLKAL